MGPAARLKGNVAAVPNLDVVSSGRYTHLSRRLSSAEATVVGDALEEALSLLQSGGRASHRAVLDAPLLTALTTPGAALLWAAALETLAERGTESVRALMTRVVEAAGVLSAAVFSNAALGF